MFDLAPILSMVRWHSVVHLTEWRYRHRQKFLRPQDDNWKAAVIILVIRVEPIRHKRRIKPLSDNL